MIKAIPIQLIRLGVAAMVVVAAIAITRQIGPIATTTVVSVTTGVTCVVVAILLHRAPVGRVTLINYAAGIFLPFGFFIGKGKLIPIVVTSWIVWTIVAGASALAVSQGYDPRVVSTDGQRHVTVLLVLLIISWMIDGFAMLYLSRVVTHRLSIHSAAARKLLLFIAILAAIIASSAFLWSHGFAAMALLVAGGPILFIGGSYGVFLAVVLITKPRWN